MDAYALQKGQVYLWEQFAYQNPGMFLPCPVVDDLLPERPLEAIAKDSAKGVDMIIGTNRDEATLFVRKEKTKFPNSWAMIEEMFDKTGNVHALPRIRAYYEVKESPFVAFASDYAFLVPSLAFAKAQSQHANVYVYRYDYVSQIEARNGLKTAHAFEMPLVFATTQSEWGRAIFGEDAPQIVVQLVHDMYDVWVNFTRDGRVQVEDWQTFSDYKTLSTYVIDTHSQCQIIDYQELMTL